MYKKRVYLTDQQKIDVVEKYLTGNYNCEELGREYNVCGSSIISLLNVRNIPINNDRSKTIRKYTVNDNYFDVIDDEYKAYFLGFLYSDGCNVASKGCVRLCLQEDDKEILEKFNTLLQSNRPLRFRDITSKHPKWKNQYELNITNKHISEQLVKLGCIQAKSLILQFPTEDQVPTHLLRHFLRGMWDGDGTFRLAYRKNGNVEFSCGLVSTNDFCIEASSFIEDSLNIKPTIFLKWKQETKPTRTMNFMGTQKAFRLINWLYEDCNIFLKRKFDRYQNAKSVLIKNGKLTNQNYINLI